MEALDKKINQYFAGKVVRKDLTKLVKGNAIVPTYVLEYLLGQYCATDDEETIQAGVKTVRKIIAKHFVHRDEAQIVKSNIRERGTHRIIDKVSVRLNEHKDRYEASFTNLGLKKVVIDDDFIKKHRKLLSEGVWCIVVLGYLSVDDRDSSPWLIESLKPIQISNINVEEYKEARKGFTKEEWIDVLMQTIGLNPEEFTFRSKLLQLARLIPFAENNYNLIELGPKGTGKSHIFSELSPHGILLSGGEVTKAKLFVNNSTGDIGLVGYWDVVAYDEFAGKSKRVDKGLVDIMKNYMANKSFSRGTQVYGASASMAFVGNTDHSVPYMLRHSNLFEALPKQYYDTAFLDRIHAYLPGWEVQKLRNEMFTNNYGFIVDYLAEVLKTMRKEDYMHDYKQFFELSNSITTRDKNAIAKTFSGLIKVIYPNREYTESEAKEILDFAIECRKRVKQQLTKMDETFEEVDFSYEVYSSGEKQTVETLEVLEHFRPTFEDNEPTGEEAKLVTEIVEETSLFEGQKVIKDNQKGVSYEKLFAAHLKGATEIHLFDPWMQHFHQAKNLVEFCLMLLQIIPKGEEITLKLFTSYKIGEQRETEKNLNTIQDNLEGSSLRFTYEFDTKLHDRWIETDHGWKIILGRGLDIFQRYDLRNVLATTYFMQEARSCKEFNVSYHKQ